MSRGPVSRGGVRRSRWDRSVSPTAPAWSHSGGNKCASLTWGRALLARKPETPFFSLKPFPLMSSTVHHLSPAQSFIGEGIQLGRRYQLRNKTKRALVQVQVCVETPTGRQRVEDQPSLKGLLKSSIHPAFIRSLSDTSHFHLKTPVSDQSIVQSPPN